MPVRDVAAPRAADGQVRADAPLEALLSSEPLRRLGALMAVDADGRLRGVVTFEQVTRALRARLATGAAMSDRRAHRDRGGLRWRAAVPSTGEGATPRTVGPRRCISRAWRRRRPVGARCGDPRHERPGPRSRRARRSAARHRRGARSGSDRRHRASKPLHSNKIARHARTRRPDHRRRPGRPAGRARGRRGGSDRGDHVQGPPGPLALQRGRGRHQRGAQPRRLVGVARVRHRQGLGLPRRPGRDRDHVPRGARRGALARAPRRHVPPQPRGQARHARVRRRLRRAHLLRRRHHRPGAAARALRAADEAPRADRPLRGVVRHRARAGRRGRVLRRGRAQHPRRLDGAVRRQGRRSWPPAAPASASSRPPTRSSAPATGSRRPTASAPR